MSDDDDVAPAGGLLDRLSNERPHVVGQVASRNGREPVRLDAASRAQLREQAAEQGLAPLCVRDVRGGDFSPLGRPADDVLVDVVEAELVGDEPAYVLAQGAHRSRDADDGRGHAATLGEARVGRQAVPGLALGAVDRFAERPADERPHRDVRNGIGDGSRRMRRSPTGLPLIDRAMAKQDRVGNAAQARTSGPSRARSNPSGAHQPARSHCFESLADAAAVSREPVDPSAFDPGTAGDDGKMARSSRPRRRSTVRTRLRAVRPARRERRRRRRQGRPPSCR